jgi:hypothetical protein
MLYRRLTLFDASLALRLKNPHTLETPLFRQVLSTVTNYNPYSGNFWYNGLEYQIPTNKKMLQEIKEKINKLAREAEQKLSVLV